MNKLLVFTLLMASSFGLNAQLQRHNKVLKLMGSRFEITAYHEDPATAWNAINAGIAEITRIENLISSWDPNSQTSEVNSNAGIKPVIVDQELFDLITRSMRISKLTDGAFDISFASMDKIWKFDGSMKAMPSPSEIATAASKIGFEKIELNAETKSVFLKEAGMKIGFGAIGKGYAAQKAKEKMESMGIKSGVVNASGDLIAWGKATNGDDFRIAIADPKNKEEILCWLNATNTSIVTSGNYEKFVMFDDIRYAHIIDPRTGYPTTGLKSVTIICANPELADALATSVFVLGQEKGLKLINQLKGIECLMITDNDELIGSDNLIMNKNL
ncbi:MAG: thiamine biosynthesis protein ApbE [Cytophagales bacterium CG12_big_fil_rev_8_21_14_0_65_40_12]|nr:MAG: thiamine biosynthesis protein ApbE [Cytophagales bacterium CG12_big_fil_rev_8_21_14_0_65_40_12]PIW05369.1 MAG: thiamine biosynthesis protein ApbE [Cytophagales bacterium CG17_big_fil_post_rev_8_21_14_2_50_40_13]